MGWEHRGNNLYYYRKKRNGRRVSSEYVGGGSLGQILSNLDMEEWEEISQNRARWHRNKQEIKNIETNLAYVHEITINLMKATFLISGYHPLKGQWRRKRNA